MKIEKYEEANSVEEIEFTYMNSLRNTFPKMTYDQLLTMMRYYGQQRMFEIYYMAFLHAGGLVDVQYVPPEINPSSPTFTSRDGYVYCYPEGTKLFDELNG